VFLDVLLQHNKDAQHSVLSQFWTT